MFPIQKYLLIWVLLVLYCQGALGVIHVEKSIEFEVGQSELTEDQINQLKVFLDYAESMTVEKIDITGFCAGTKASYHCLKTSRERSLLIFEYLQSSIPAQEVFELRLSGANDAVKEKSIHISGYFLEPDAAPMDANLLFPEEFENAASLPNCLIPRTDFEERRYLIRDLEFVGNSATLLASAYPSLQALTQYLLNNPQLQVRIEGYVNGSGGGRYLKNQGNPEKVKYKNGKHLSEARASSVMDYLVAEGIHPNRLSFVGKGGANKLYRNPQNETENAANRRIEIILSE